MPVAVEPKRSPPGWRWSLVGRAIRLVVLLILLVCGLLVLPRAFPNEVAPAQLVEDLRDGRVRHLEPERGEHALADGGPVRWSTGRLTWYQTSVPGPGWPSAPITADGVDHEELLNDLVADSPGRVSMDRWEPGDLHGERSLWDRLWDRPSALLAPAAVLLWVVVFLVMLGDWIELRYASHSAWFWLFTIGLVGVLVYLLLEPRPLWSRGADGFGDPARRLGGVAGFLAALLLGVATVGAAFGLRAIFR